MKPGKEELQKENMLQLLFLEDLEVAKSFLRQEGLDPDEEGKRGALFVQKFLRDKKITQAKSKATLWAKAKQLLQEKINSSSLSIEDLVSNAPQLAGINFRNLSEIDPTDLAEIISEQKLLELIEQLEKENKKEDTE
jgi:hypothetical protein